MQRTSNMFTPHGRLLLTGASVLVLGLGVGLAPHHALAADTGCAKVNKAQGAPQSVINHAAGGGGGAPQNVINNAAGGGGAPQNVINQAAGGGGVPKNVLNDASANAARAGGTQMAENAGAKNPADCR